MSTAHWVQTIIEILLIVAVILGWIYEPLLARWERKMSRKMLKAFKHRKDYRL